jgi:hypothetical protein
VVAVGTHRRAGRHRDTRRPRRGRRPLLRSSRPDPHHPAPAWLPAPPRPHTRVVRRAGLAPGTAG